VNPALLLALLAAAALAAPLHAQNANPPAPAEAKAPAAKRPAKKANPALEPVADVAGLPRVLLIGDSISIGYTLPVRQALAGQANVHRIPTNGGPTKNGTANLAKWLGTSKWDVIHFNFGLHDLRHMADGKRQVEPADYEANLRTIVAALRKTGARVIFATTTPVPEGPLSPSRTFGDVAEYNRIARRVMAENGVAVNDLHAAITPSLPQHQNARDVHFNPAGSEALGQPVAQAVRGALGNR